MPLHAQKQFVNTFTGPDDQGLSYRLRDCAGEDLSHYSRPFTNAADCVHVDIKNMGNKPIHWETGFGYTQVPLSLFDDQGHPIARYPRIFNCACWSGQLKPGDQDTTNFDISREFKILHAGRYRLVMGPFRMQKKAPATQELWLDLPDPPKTASGSA